jgi:5-dehydro-2-deoxygluconokinase
MALTSTPTPSVASPTSRFAPDRSRDIICLGRLAVDLYAQQVGARLEDVSSFAKYLGGSSANIAFGCARLGLASAMLATTIWAAFSPKRSPGKVATSVTCASIMSA